MGKSLLDSIKSPSVGVCDCCNEPVFDPAHQLARTIFAVLPPIKGRDTQALYDEIVWHIEEAFGELLVLSKEFEAEIDEDAQAVN